MSPDLNELIAVPEAVRHSIRILVADDERALRETCASVLGHEGYQVTTAARGPEALDMVKRRSFDIALIDLYMGDVPGIELLKAALVTNRDTLAIVITGRPSIESSLEVLRAGAWDYLPKPFTGTQLQILIGRAAHAVAVARETRAREQQPGVVAVHGDSAVLGTAPRFREALDLARKVAGTDASVFITGESGSGKEMIAQFIHANSRRQSRPIIAINCAALPEPLLESEMFGHVKGAFTGAVRDKSGLLEAANGGTLFLDELVEMAAPIQAKLLRVIQDGVVRRVGSERSDAVVNVRFIAATNRDPEEALRAGALRMDLYYRLRVVPIHLPPLRERQEDIPLLATHFLAGFWKAHRGDDLPLPRLTKAAVWALQKYGWPGNVRELQNVIEHAAVLLEPGANVRPEDIPFFGDASGKEEPEAAADEAIDADGYYPARERLVSRFDRRFLTQVVLRAGGNLSKAARMARVDRTTFYRLMERYGLQRDSLAAPPE
ncbi:MAG TPA: sigma-54 dependent transcriptional regulator [Gemmatimonadales bacterium]|nr:sigma-54 dependent transcriptional regulator [Gemmatimonadales bacterium]